METVKGSWWVTAYPKQEVPFFEQLKNVEKAFLNFMDSEEKIADTIEVFSFLEEIEGDAMAGNLPAGRIAKIKKMMDIYNKHYAPFVEGSTIRKEYLSINCRPCIPKAYLFFVKLKTEVEKS